MSISCLTELENRMFNDFALKLSEENIESLSEDDMEENIESLSEDDLKEFTKLSDKVSKHKDYCIKECEAEFNKYVKSNLNVKGYVCFVWNNENNKPMFFKQAESFDEAIQDIDNDFYCKNTNGIDDNYQV